MAEVWAATNEATGAEVCVKVLVAGDDEEAVPRFRREAHAAARLSHRAIVRVFDLLELNDDGAACAEGEHPFALAIVMELLHGKTLAELLLARGKLTVDEAIDLVLPVCSALGHAHRAGVVHRDVKPDNIFLAEDSDGHVTPKLLDFGISKLGFSEERPITRIGAPVGTPSFMSPEQVEGRAVDPRSDVFALGIVVYMMLDGRNPFDASRVQTVAQILERQPIPLTGVGDGLWKVIERALHKSPEARFADARELGVALRIAVGRTSVTESGVGPARIEVAPSIPPSLAGGARSQAKPLGGDSIVTVPPVGGGDSEARSGFPGRAPVARGRAVRIVVAALGIAVAMVVGARFLASPPPREGATSAAARSPMPPPVESPSLPAPPPVQPVTPGAARGAAPAAAAAASPEPAIVDAGAVGSRDAAAR